MSEFDGYTLDELRTEWVALGNTLATKNAQLDALRAEIVEIELRRNALSVEGRIIMNGGK